MNHSNESNYTVIVPPTSYLKLILGSMYSGKTSELLKLYKQFTFCDIPVCVINYSDDKRYHDTMLSNHDKVMIPCIQTRKLVDIFNYTLIKSIELKNTTPIVIGSSVFSFPTELYPFHDQIFNADVILINEGQFFDDIVEFTKKMLLLNKKVYIAGLDGDFKRERFGSLLDLIPLCDEVVKLSAICNKCKKNPGIFSMRISSEKQQLLIGSDNYISVCRRCYDIHNEL